MKNKIAVLVEKAVKSSVQKGLLPEISLPYIEVEVPANNDHGDYATNIALILASQAKQNPRKIAQVIQENLTDPENIIAQMQIAGPGFINFFIKENIWRDTLRAIEEEKENLGAVPQAVAKKCRWNL